MVYALVCATSLTLFLLTLRFPRNKWVLNVTSVPLFFLFTQLIIAVILFYLGHTLRIITTPMMRVDLPILKGLASTIILNVLSLR